VTKLLSDEALANLQRSLLGAVLHGRPLPGASRAPAFADRAFLQGRPTIALLDENLAPELSIDDPRPLRRLSREELLEEARREGDVPYLRFSAPERVGDAVRLTLEASIVPADPEKQVLGLSGLQAAFRETDGEWRVEGEPVTAAT
jgi:ribosomal protein L21E